MDRWLKRSRDKSSEGSSGIPSDRKKNSFLGNLMDRENNSCSAPSNFLEREKDSESSPGDPLNQENSSETSSENPSKQNHSTSESPEESFVVPNCNNKFLIQFGLKTQWVTCGGYRKVTDFISCRSSKVPLFLSSGSYNSLLKLGTSGLVLCFRGTSAGFPQVRENLKKSPKNRVHTLLEKLLKYLKIIFIFKHYGNSLN